MASIDGIDTNLTKEELADVLRALDTDETVAVPKSASVYESSAGGEFDYRGSRYAITEFTEKVQTLYRMGTKSTVSSE